MKLSLLYESNPLSKRAQIRLAKQTGTKIIYNDGRYKLMKFDGLEAAPALMLYCRGTALCTKNERNAVKYLSKGPLYMAFKDGKRLFLADHEFLEVSYTDNISIGDAGISDDIEELLKKLVRSGAAEQLGRTAQENIASYLRGEILY